VRKAMRIIDKILENKIVIEPVDKERIKTVKLDFDKVIKPLDSMGVFEKQLSLIGAIQGLIRPVTDKAVLAIFCADNGIVEEGVSQSGQEVTFACAKNISLGKSVVGNMAKSAGIDFLTYDVGINTDEAFDTIIDKKIMRGTRNFRYEPAMTVEEARLAIEEGIEIAQSLKEKGYSLILLGEMGIGNTTTSSAVAAAILNLDADKVTGRGSGLSDEGLRKKKSVINEAINKYDLHSKDAFTVLRTVGGLDIAAMAGAIIGGAMNKLPIVLDGFISEAAALVAEEICPGVREYLIPSHKSRELGARRIEERLGLCPVIDGGLALGEGTGAVLMTAMLNTVNYSLKNSIRFEETEVDQYVRQDATNNA